MLRCKTNMCSVLFTFKKCRPEHIPDSFLDSLLFAKPWLNQYNWRWTGKCVNPWLVSNQPCKSLGSSCLLTIKWWYKFPIKQWHNCFNFTNYTLSNILCTANPAPPYLTYIGFGIVFLPDYFLDHVLKSMRQKLKA